MPGSVQEWKMKPDEWWTRFAGKAATQMKLGGVKSFRIEKNDHGSYSFEVIPEDAPNTERSDREPKSL